MPGVPLATHPRSSPSSFFSGAGLASPPFSHFVWARRHCLTRKEILQRGKKIKDASQNLIFGETLARSHTRGMRRLHERTPPPDSDSKASEFPLFDPETSFSGSPPLPASAQPSITGSKKRRRSRLTSHCQVRGYFFQDARKKEKKEGSDARHLQSRIRKKMIFFFLPFLVPFMFLKSIFFAPYLFRQGPSITVWQSTHLKTCSVFLLPPLSKDSLVYLDRQRGSESFGGIISISRQSGERWTKEDWRGRAYTEAGIRDASEPYSESEIGFTR